MAYALRITDIDPIEHDLIFERFLNEERISPPDIDIDFCENRRGEVIEYVTRKYGRENVAQIITFGTMKAKAVVRDVGRVLDMSYADVDKIAKMIPFDLKMTLDKALAESPPLQDAYQKDPKVKELIDISRRLEGTTRHASTHAAGVVISPVPLTDLVPLASFKGGAEGVTTQYDMKGVERIGLLKMDFLGLRTLTLIDNCVKMIAAQTGERLEIDLIRTDDPKTYEMFTAGRTSGLFQFESDGMRDILKRFKPDRLEHLTALNALYRPGPMAMIDDVVKRRHGQTKVAYDHPLLEPILSETYGIMVYQEQVMQIASALAGYTLGEADILRKAMGKKKADVMATQKGKFLKGCADRSVNEKKASKIWDYMEQFAGYGFNKSHSAAYAWLAYQTAYLKANYPAYFMAALLTSERANTDKMVQYIGECRAMEIAVLPPDCNSPRCTSRSCHGRRAKADSLRRSARGSGGCGAAPPVKDIRFGLAAIKNVGEGAVEAILAARSARRPLQVDVRVLRTGRPARGEPARGGELHQERLLRFAGEATRLADGRHRPRDGGGPEAAARPRAGPGQPARHAGRGGARCAARAGAPARRAVTGRRASVSPTRRNRSGSSSPATRSSATRPSSRSGPTPPWARWGRWGRRRRPSAAS